MQDDPPKERLLAEVAGFLMRDVLPAVQDEGLAFRIRVAAHLVGMVARETASEELVDRAELDGLIALGVADDAHGAAAIRQAVASGNQALAERIRDHGGEPASDAVILASLRARLAISNPRFSFADPTGEDEWTS